MHSIKSRTNMVEQQIRPWSVSQPQVLKVLSQIEREHFVPFAYQALAYADVDIPLPQGQTLLQPMIVGRALQALALTGTEKVLEIGTGTGYITACLTVLAKHIVSLEIQPVLMQEADKNLRALHSRHLTLIEENGLEGFEKEAPYEAILVTGAYPMGVPDKLKAQLSPGGRLFAFVGTAPAMRAVVITAGVNGQYTYEDLFETVVPALIHAPQPQAFVF